MEPLLCPVLVGRSAEAARVTGALDGAKKGRGSALFIVGEPGIGKSRLTRQAIDEAVDAGMWVSTGRAVSVGAAVPFRPLAEALVNVSAPEDADLAPYTAALARLLPSSSEGGAVDESPLVLGEGLLRLLRSLGGRRGALLVLEDLHWADADTLAVIEYLADHVGRERIAVLATLRPDPPAAAEVARALEQRHAGTTVELSPLDAGEVERMVARCLGVRKVPGEIGDIATAAEGVPLLVEDLLAAATGAGVLVEHAGSWQVVGDARVVPRTFAASVEARLGEGTRDARRVLQAAALIGRSFDWSLLAGAVGVDDDTVAAEMRWAVGAQLVSTDRDQFRFRHALTRDAVLATILPSDRPALATSVLATVERAHPDLGGEWREVAAALAVEAGDPERAADLLLGAGRRALAAGALASAEQTLRAAADLTADVERRLEIDESLCETLALAGRTDDVFAVGQTLLDRMVSSDAQPDRRAAAHIRLARAAVAGARWPEASQHIEAARVLAGGEASVIAQLDALAAHVAMGRRRPDVAVALARGAVHAALSAGQAEVACEALEVIGRAARTRDLDEAAAAFRQALELAETSGLVIWRIRALHELGTIDLLDRARLERLRQARQLALDAGALTTVAVLDLQLAAGHHEHAEGVRCAEAAIASAEAAARLNMYALEAAGWAMAAGGYSMSGPREKMEELIARAVAVDDGVDTQASIWGARALASLIDDQRGRARRELDTAMANIRLAPVLTPYPAWGMYALVCSVDNRDAEPACDELAASGATASVLNRGWLQYARAVNAGRSGHRDEAAALSARGDALLEPMPWWRALGRRLVAEAALADGWGEPVGWLQDAATTFAAAGHEALLQACRTLLRQAGVELDVVARPAAKRARGVPPALAQLGVTKREAEVLALVGEGLSNGAIAERLYLSPRTIEKHVENLVRKTGVRGRSHLVAYAASSENT